VREREDHDLVADDLVGQRERKTAEHRDATILALLPLRCGVRELHDHLEHGSHVVLELGAETGLA
jgi:hypothetical protein